MRRLRWIALVPLVSAGLMAADPSLGTWTLNVKKSNFLPGPGFRSETRSYEDVKDGVKVTIRSVDGKGRSVTTIYVSTPDGTQHSVSGSGGGPADAVALKRVNDYTAESKLMHAGKEIAKTTRTVSSDGRTMTIVYDGLDPDGTPVKYTMLFDRTK